MCGLMLWVSEMIITTIYEGHNSPDASFPGASPSTFVGNTYVYKTSYMHAYIHMGQYPVP